ncbi:FAD/NAD(P)-binding protein [Lentilactobacillus kefiri]|uniref:FAD-dependent urate hydroxylase HpyO/Asp monooxygenase CreE-like FAD/NAD(P)-binding domain-containing protein n=2 Tax=Lentilactobacillus kefiri TaxID=33962 RepID=A0A8E1V1W8_LENKE|nr:FAD/NAD(P)-binding protein [Lentilactobacillus kefiri]KRL70015.1 hypothetical protein FD08_GL001245 [Lentilactobacillus parakefiri DSM 10551]KRM53975.1 hypothetical protein FC95_GL001677 [Lentilactobacillus kefiri DSM 20587 = JCM 5818]MCJ2160826.1 FAD/NAD(P)-binding protein [Lentilactobacillus kefiri]MCP9368445.1 FAD/NAD(P)-binding protein [Lentilactobacillus kefiri]MDH5107925.1 FAD/NAD(P)-binding protein [Lentilactobacillus kefiri]
MRVGIIGAGPRGILVTSQLFNQYKYHSEQTEPLSITLFDPMGIGGRVWRTDQSDELIMNSAADQITLFTDSSVDMSSKVYDGPSLFEWARSDEANSYLANNGYSSDIIAAAAQLKINGYAPRVLFGAYIKWFYADLLSQQPTEISTSLMKAQVTDLSYDDDHKPVIKTDEGTYTFDKVVMSLGQQDNYLNDDEQKLAEYAQKNALNYVAPTHPGDADLSGVPAGEPTIVRGLGLSFIDYVTELTLGRGGHYMQNEDGSLFYQPSGREPRIIAGSGRGIPYYPKPINEKGYGETASPKFLTKENIKKNSKDGKLPFDKFMDLLLSDLELVYYKLTINDKYPYENSNEFEKAFISNPDKDAVLKQFGFQEEDAFEWDYIINPFKDVHAVGTEDYQTVIINWLNGEIKDSLKGSKTGPLAAARDLLRDFRPVFRQMIVDDCFTNQDYVEKFLGNLDSVINFLIMGPPVVRSKQLSALIRSGVVTILAPGMQVKGQDGWFVTASPKRNTDKFRSTTLIEARVPKANLGITANPILESLVNAQLARSHQLKIGDKDVDIHAVDVNPSTDQLLDAGGNVQSNVYLWGSSLDGLRYVTNAAPRPGVNDTNLQTADKLAAEVLGLPTANDVAMD